MGHGCEVQRPFPMAFPCKRHPGRSASKSIVPRRHVQALLRRRRHVQGGKVRSGGVQARDLAGKRDLTGKREG